MLTKTIATVLAALGIALGVASIASAQPKKCDLATVASVVCPDPGRAGEQQGYGQFSVTRNPNTEVIGRNDDGSARFGRVDHDNDPQQGR